MNDLRHEDWQFPSYASEDGIGKVFVIVSWRMTSVTGGGVLFCCVYCVGEQATALYTIAVIVALNQT